MGRLSLKVLTWVLALSGLISTPALADMTAKYVAPNNAFGMTIEIASNGDVRGATTSPNSYFITRAGQSYLVQAGFKGPAVMRVEDMALVMAEQMKRLAPDFQAHANEAPPLTLRKGSIVTIRGRSGIAYFMGPQMPNAPTERPAIVISADPTLAPLGAAMAKQFEMSILMMKQVMGEANPFAAMTKILRTGAPIVFAGMELDSVNNDPIPTSRFELPAAPLTLEEVRKNMGVLNP